MTSLANDTLLKIKLPSGQDNQLVDILVHVTMRRESEPKGAEVVMDDSVTPRLLRRFYGEDIMPASYQPTKVGTMTAFLSIRSDQVRAIVEVGGARYGNLTIARAADIMYSRDISAEQALDESLAISAWVLGYHQRLTIQADALLAS